MSETDEALEIWDYWMCIRSFFSLLYLVSDVQTVTTLAVKREEGEAKATQSSLHHLQRHRENRLPKLFRPRSLLYYISILSYDMMLLHQCSVFSDQPFSWGGLEFTGRTNHAELIMLPKGEWPHWWGTSSVSLYLSSMIVWTTNQHHCFFRCRICCGSGLDYCFRCHGTGEFREPMGFHFTVGSKWALRVCTSNWLVG